MALTDPASKPPPKPPLVLSWRQMILAGSICLLIVVAMVRNTADKQDEGMRATTPVPTSVPSAEITEPDIKAQRAEAIELSERIATYRQPCDNAWKEMAKAISAVGRNPANVYQAYPVASQTQKICERSWKQIGEIDVPPALKFTLANDTRDALNTCHIASNIRIEAAEQFMEIFDGDMRPSALAAASEQIEGGKAMDMECAAALAGLRLNTSELPTLPKQQP